MSESKGFVAMVTYQFEIEAEEWETWKRQVPREKALHDRLRELMQADVEGRIQERDDADGAGGTGPAAVERRRPEPSAEVEHDQPASDGVDGLSDARIEEIVAEVSASWDDTPERLETRRAAARAALHLFAEREAIGKADVIDGAELHREYPVEGQNPETFWRKNVRPVLKAVADYSKAEHGYVLADG